MIEALEEKIFYPGAGDWVDHTQDSIGVESPLAAYSAASASD